MYYCTTSLENIGSLTNIVSSFTNPEKSDKHGSLPKLLLIPCTVLFHLSLKLPGSFDARTHKVSGVSSEFQFEILEKFSHLRTKL